MNSPVRTAGRDVPCRLTVFAFIWVCQAMVHQLFFYDWAVEGSIWGWLVTIFIFLVWMRPSSLTLFTGFLFSSIAHSVDRWPYVVNHILLDVVIETTMLIAIGGAIIRSYRAGVALDKDARNRIFDRFAPVIGVMLVILYYMIFVSKMNWDHLNVARTCVYPFYQDVLDKLPFLPSADMPGWLTAILSTFLIVEIVIPVMLTFKKTRFWALAIGLPFHFLLGIIGHWTFSAFVYGLYSLFLMVPLTNLLADIRSHITQRQLNLAKTVARGVAVIAFGIFAFAILTFDSSGVETINWSFNVYQDKPWVFDDANYLWAMWAIVAGSLFATAMYRGYFKENNSVVSFKAGSPGYLWIMVGVVVVNCLSPYLGLKTETSAAMYSNLRTEGDINNHVFMPALRLTGYQDDLAEILETDHPRLSLWIASVPLHDRSMVPRKLLVTRFELQRVVSETDFDFYVTYRSNGDVHTFTQRNGVASDPALATKHPLLLRKLLLFRPVFAGELSYCQH